MKNVRWLNRYRGILFETEVNTFTTNTRKENIGVKHEVVEDLASRA